MAVKHIIDNALKTPMTRKEFLGQLGGLLLAVIGVTSILHALGGQTSKYNRSESSASTGTTTGGYGSTPYGGDADGA